MDVPVVKIEAEINALPNGSVLFDADLDVMVKYDGAWHYWGIDYEESDEEGTVMLPALLLHVGDAKPWHTGVT